MPLPILFIHRVDFATGLMLFGREAPDISLEDVVALLPVLRVRVHPPVVRLAALQTRQRKDVLVVVEGRLVSSVVLAGRVHLFKGLAEVEVVFLGLVI